MNSETLAIYAQDLSNYELEDVAAVLDDIGTEKIEDFKQLWPAVGVFLDAIRGRIRANRPSLEREAIDRLNAEAKHRKEHPEEYVTINLTEMLDEIAAKKGMA